MTSEPPTPAFLERLKHNSLSLWERVRVRASG
jgi:hypothetical protein